MITDAYTKPNGPGGRTPPDNQGERARTGPRQRARSRADRLPDATGPRQPATPLARWRGPQPTAGDQPDLQTPRPAAARRETITTGRTPAARYADACRQPTGTAGSTRLFAGPCSEIPGGFLGALYPYLFLGIPFVGVVFAHGSTSSLIGAFTAAILALGLNEVAYAAELVRAGIISVDEGQSEAAYSIGMSGGLTMRRVVLPQAMRVIIPPMGNETITMLKMTSLVSVISGHDLLTTVQQVYAQNFEQIPLLIVASLWYLALTTVLTIGQHYLEKHFGRGFGQADAGGAERKALKRVTRNG